MKPKLTVVIPSRSHARQIEFLRRATESVRNQTAASQYEIGFIVGLDQGDSLSAADVTSLGIDWVSSLGASQAAALNAALRKVAGDFVAFLEDDDEWMPDYLKFATQAITSCSFVSSTQFEVNEQGKLLRINDFPTPSGWFMPVSTLQAVGEFNEAHRFHLDNEWLGRLAESGLRRMHMVEATGPINVRYAQQARPWLAEVLKNAGSACRLARHQSPYPLVKRLVHTRSGMSMISSNAELRELSQLEYQRLITRFGRIPT